VRNFFRLITPVLALTLVAAACGGDGESSGDGSLTVIATTTILGDIARNVVGDSGSVATILPIGTDPHDYQASSRQAAAIAEADLVIANGLGLEEGLLDVLAAAASDGANIVEIAPLLDPIPFAGNHEAARGGDDPHFWLDPIRDAEAAHAIAAELTAIDPNTDWIGRAASYGDQLTAVDSRIAGILSSVPVNQRKLITNHDAFSYFAERYGFEVIGAVIPGGSTLAAPSSAELTKLADQIRSEGVAAIFTETTGSEDLADALAAESGDQVAVVQLYSGSLGEPGSDADTLIGMLETNARLISGSLWP